MLFKFFHFQFHFAVLFSILLPGCSKFIRLCFALYEPKLCTPLLIRAYICVKIQDNTKSLLLSVSNGHAGQERNFHFLMSDIACG